MTDRNFKILILTVKLQCYNALCIILLASSICMYTGIYV
jgi:hypothetical protein